MGLCALGGPSAPDAACLIVFLSASDHFMITLGAPLVIFAASYTQP